MDVPAFGRSKGVFEVFLPGLFLFLNLTVFALLVSGHTPDSFNVSNSGVFSVTVTIVVAVPFGYVLGMTLRLLKAGLPDRLSGGYLRLECNYPVMRLWQRPNEGPWEQPFPFIRWIGVVCEAYLPLDVQNFYKIVWQERNIHKDLVRDCTVDANLRGTGVPSFSADDGENKQFFNFCKVLVGCNDPETAAELHTLEAQCRFVGEAFYALAISALVMSISFVTDFYRTRVPCVYLAIVVVAYLFSIWVILRSYRPLRIREAEAVFAATYRHREAFGYPAMQQSDSSGVVL